LSSSDKLETFPVTTRSLEYSDTLVRHRRPSFYDLLCINKKFLVYNLVMRNLKLRYRKSFFGFFWTILIPAVNALVYYVVFQFVMRVQIPNYLLFILSGLIPWTFFSSAILSSMESLVANHSILNKVPIPPYAFPFAEILTCLINFLGALPVLVIVALLHPFAIDWTVVLFPIPIVLLALQAYGVGLILAYGNVYFRDLRHVMVILIQIWFYATPIIYAPSMIPERYRFLMYFNPVGHLFESLHGYMMGYPFEANWLIVPPLWTLVIIGLGFLSVRRWNALVVESV